MAIARVLDTLILKAGTDYVAVFTQDFTQVFPRARAIKATVKEESKVMEHPVETGTIVTDHRIILPVEIELSLILQSADYQDTYKSIKQYFLNATLLVVQTRSGIYKNQLIASLPHEENPDQYDALSVALKLKQVQFTTARFVQIVPQDPANTNTVDRGTQQGTPVVNPDVKKRAAISYGGYPA